MRLATIRRLFDFTLYILHISGSAVRRRREPTRTFIRLETGACQDMHEASEGACQDMHKSRDPLHEARGRFQKVSQTEYESIGQK